MTHLCPDCKKRYIEHDEFICDECWRYMNSDYFFLEDDYAVDDSIRESVDTHE